MSKRILVPIADGSEELEAIAIVDILRRAKAEVEMVGVGELTLKCSKGVKVLADTSIDQIRDREYDAIVIPGGMPGAENIKNSEKFANILMAHAKKGVLIGAICASPAIVLEHYGLTKGKRITCHPAFAHLIRNGIYEPKPLVFDPNLLTGKSAGYAIDFAIKLVEILFPKDILHEVKMGLSIA